MTIDIQREFGNPILASEEATRLRRQAAEIIDRAYAIEAAIRAYGEAAVLPMLQRAKPSTQAVPQPGEQPATPYKPTPWQPFLSDRADGVRGRYALARFDERGTRWCWNRKSQEWAAYCDEPMTLETATALLRSMQPATPSTVAQPAAVDALAEGDFRDCEFCGCHTNAKLRQCCRRGYKADKPSTQPGEQQ